MLVVVTEAGAPNIPIARIDPRLNRGSADVGDLLTRLTQTTFGPLRGGDGRFTSRGWREIRPSAGPGAIDVVGGDLSAVPALPGRADAARARTGDLPGRARTLPGPGPDDCPGPGPTLPRTRTDLPRTGPDRLPGGPGPVIPADRPVPGGPTRPADRRCRCHRWSRTRSSSTGSSSRSDTLADRGTLAIEPVVPEARLLRAPAGSRSRPSRAATRSRSTRRGSTP